MNTETACLTILAIKDRNASRRAVNFLNNAATRNGLSLQWRVRWGETAQLVQILSNMTRNEVMSCRNMGRKTFREIEGLLCEGGIWPSESTAAFQARLYAQNREKNRVAVAKYHAKHPERVRASVARYRAAHPEKVRAWNAAQMRRHPESHRVQVRKYYAAHRDEINARRKERRDAYKFLQTLATAGELLKAVRSAQ